LKKSIFAALAAAFTLVSCGGATGGGSGEGASRSQIRIVGSSTVYPFTTAVAERFAQAHPNFTAPIVESTGTGGGMNLFCAGVGANHPDMTNASRRMKASELELCNRNGVNQVIEVPVGIDGLALIESARTPTNFQLTARDIYMALAANPFGRGPNRARTWRDVNPALPAVAIQVYGPPPTSGTRDSFAELILEKGCDSDPAMAQLKEQDRTRHTAVCTQIREDGPFIEAGENDNLLVQRVSENQGAVGVLGFSFLEENAERVRGIPINGVAPTAQTIQNFTYPGARQMFLYVKGEHIGAIPGMPEFLAEYARGWANGGYLSQRGLIPSPPEVQARATQNIQGRRAMTAADLR
jgi:phosphate transport system substrate-binding protein